MARSRPKQLPRTRRVRFDARRSPAVLINRELLEAIWPSWESRNADVVGAGACDQTLRWLTVSDQMVSGELGRALLEVKQNRVHQRHGHARWSTYVRAFVGKTQRWTQYEMRRERELECYPKLAEAFQRGQLGKSHLRVILSVVTAETQDLWLARGSSMTVRDLEVAARQARAEQVEPSATTPEQDEEPRGLAQAVELARKVAGYQIGAGQAVGMMAGETLSGIAVPPDEAAA